jgi:cellulose synthase/poly-beta-1,6-N-acetylglucosamine synthase-like glycosyltransferase
MWFYLLLPAALYAALMLGVAVVTRLVARRESPPPRKSLPRIAVLVAARNEETRLHRCLDALLAQDYPADRIDIYVANDHSTDGTAAVIERYRQRTAAAVPAGGPFDDGFAERDADASSFERIGGDGAPAALPRVHAVEVPDPTDHVRGKALAIHTAVEACDHDLLLVTDADCAPPPEWARSLVAYFDDPDLGMVCGHTYVETHGDWVSELQALDWAYLLSVSSVLTESGRPVTAMGNNMALRRAAYEAVGGYPALPFSVTEDYMLFKSIAEQTDYHLRYPSSPALRNYTLPLGRAVDMYQQRRRWARGGMKANAGVYAMYTLTYLAHLVPLLALFFVPGPALAVLAAKVGADFAVLWTTLGRSRRRHLLRTFPLFEAYLFFYLITLPAVLLLFPRINWKDRKL